MSMTLYDYIISIIIFMVTLVLPSVRCSLIVLKGIGITTEFGIGIGHLRISLSWILLVFLHHMYW